MRNAEYISKLYDLLRAMNWSGDSVAETQMYIVQLIELLIEKAENEGDP